VELFPTDDRLTGYSLAYNIGAGVVGGTTPLVATWLISITGNSFAPCFYLMGWSVICLVALGLMRDRSREPLMNGDPEAPE
jgi:MHS family proline/betaine transporter-like MFS transporter